MLKWVFFFTLFSFSRGAVVRIVNGTDAKEGEFLFAVSLRFERRHTCGATILDDRHVLTAAHCVCDDNIVGVMYMNHESLNRKGTSFQKEGEVILLFNNLYCDLWVNGMQATPLDPAPYTIQYGSVNISPTYERAIQVSKITCNNFSMESLINDAAVLELNSLIPHYWRPVKLSRHFDTSVGHRGVIIGWGRLWANGPIPTVLQKLEVIVYPDSICGRNFDVTQHVCFGAPIGGACNGDSGTALIVDGEQVAIASFITTTCGTANQWFPNVYAKITASMDFIDSIVPNLA